MKKLIASLAVAFTCLAGFASADTWTLDGASSRLAFGSVKKDTVGEVHSFENLSGMVGSDGMAKIEIDLTSVQTNIDIRNERMIEHVFQNIAAATVAAEIDMDDVNGLEVGGTTTTFAEITLSLLGIDVELEAELFVARLTETQVMVTSNDMLMLSTADAGLTAGVDKLMELAKLPGITRVSPVTLRLIFNQDEKKAEAAPAAPATQVTLAGDAKAGRKVFAKCKACHQLKEGRNAAGPSLYQVFGATAGQVDGFKYSDAMKNSAVTWTVETLTAFIENPKEYMPGTKMNFKGLNDATDIENLLAYIQDKAS